MKTKNVRDRQWRRYIRKIGGWGYDGYRPSRHARRHTGQHSVAVIYTRDW